MMIVLCISTHPTDHSKTSNFTNYSKMGFNDFDQVDLSNLFKKLDQMGALVLLSNSDPKNEDLDDEFFDKLYNIQNRKDYCKTKY